MGVRGGLEEAMLGCVSEVMQGTRAIGDDGGRGGAIGSVGGGGGGDDNTRWGGGVG